ncbi:MAG: cytochrome P450 [Zavarzinia sp.]|nr:cytochrome P450 [Zavarzinia sp.]
MENLKIPVDLVAPVFAPQTFGSREKIQEIFTTLRRDYPLSIAEVPGYDPHWIVTKYEDIREITRQDELFLSADRSKTLASQYAEKMMRDYTGGLPHIFRTLVHMDEPEHTDYRNVTAGQFMPQMIKALEPKVRVMARKYADKLAAMAPECDFAWDLAFYYPLEVVMNVIGIPEEDHAKMLRLTQWLFTYADPDLKRPGSDPTDPGEIIKTWDIVYAEFKEYYDKVIADRRGCPRDDVASLVANGKVRGCPMEDRAMISYFAILSSAGHDTTSATTATSMWKLAEDPALLKRLQDDPKLIAGFVEESIRWASPVQQFVRSAKEDYVLRGRQIKKGDLLYLSYISGNRDEDAFENPQVFDPARSPNRHIGFGYGSHICLGQHLARLEMKCFWEEVIPRLKSLEMAGEGSMAESEFVCGPKHVPIRFEMTA